MAAQPEFDFIEISSGSEMDDMPVKRGKMSGKANRKPNKSIKKMVVKKRRVNEEETHDDDGHVASSDIPLQNPHDESPKLTKSGRKAPKSYHISSSSSDDDDNDDDHDNDDVPKAVVISTPKQPKRKPTINARTTTTTTSSSSSSQSTPDHEKPNHEDLSLQCVSRLGLQHHQPLTNSSSQLPPSKTLKTISTWVDSDIIASKSRKSERYAMVFPGILQIGTQKIDPTITCGTFRFVTEHGMETPTLTLALNEPGMGVELKGQVVKSSSPFLVLTGNGAKGMMKCDLPLRDVIVFDSWSVVPFTVAAVTHTITTISETSFESTITTITTQEDEL